MERFNFGAVLRVLVGLLFVAMVIWGVIWFFDRSEIPGSQKSADTSHPQKTSAVSAQAASDAKANDTSGAKQDHVETAMSPTVGKVVKKDADSGKSTHEKDGKREGKEEKKDIQKSDNKTEQNEKRSVEETVEKPDTAGKTGEDTKKPDDPESKSAQAVSGVKTTEKNAKQDIKASDGHGSDTAKPVGDEKSAEEDNVTSDNHEPKTAKTVADIQSKPPLTFQPDISAWEALDRLKSGEHETIQQVYVTGQNGKLLGSVTQEGLKKASDETRIRDMMEKDLITLSAKTDITSASDTFTEHQAAQLPVVDRRGKLTGVLSASAVIDALRHNAEKTQKE